MTSADLHGSAPFICSCHFLFNSPILLVLPIAARADTDFGSGPFCSVSFPPCRLLLTNLHPWQTLSLSQSFTGSPRLLWRILALSLGMGGGALIACDHLCGLPPWATFSKVQDQPNYVAQNGNKGALVVWIGCWIIFLWLVQGVGSCLCCE